MTKTCAKCGVEKPLEEFSQSKNCRYGRSSQCKACKVKYDRAYRDQNQEILRQKAHDRYARDIQDRQHYRSVNKARLNETAKQYKERIKYTWFGFFCRTWADINRRTVNGSHPNRKNGRCNSYQKKGIRVDFSKEEYRHWCRQRAELIEWMFAEGLDPSIDRRDPDGHYSLNNIRVIPLAENLRLSRGNRKLATASK